MRTRKSFASRAKQTGEQTSSSLFQSRPFTVQKQSEENSQPEDIKTSLMRAQRYGHSLSKMVNSSDRRSSDAAEKDGIDSVSQTVSAKPTHSSYLMPPLQTELSIGQKSDRTESPVMDRINYPISELKSIDRGVTGVEKVHHGTPLVQPTRRKGKNQKTQTSQSQSSTKTTTQNVAKGNSSAASSQSQSSTKKTKALEFSSHTGADGSLNKLDRNIPYLKEVLTSLQNYGTLSQVNNAVETVQKSVASREQDKQEHKKQGDPGNHEGRLKFERDTLLPALQQLQASLQQQEDNRRAQKQINQQQSDLIAMQQYEALKQTHGREYLDGWSDARSRTGFEAWKAAGKPANKGWEAW